MSALETSSTPTGTAGPDQILLGLTVLIAERLRVDPQRLAFAVGLIEQTAVETRQAVGRVAEPGARLAGRVARLAEGLPGAGIVTRRVDAAQERLAVLLARSRRRGVRSVAASRVEAVSFLRASTAETLAWVRRDLLPQLIDGALPEIRTRVLPAILADISADPQIRSLVVEQSRGVVGDAAEHLRTSAASTDDRIESALRRLLGLSSRPGSASA